MELLDKIFNWIANIIIALFILFLIWKFLVPYWVGDYERSVDYYKERHK